MTELKMQPGWVTPAQLHMLIEQRGVADSPVFGRLTATELRKKGDWREWPEHVQHEVFQQLGIAGVVMPLGPGGKLVSECAVVQNHWNTLASDCGELVAVGGQKVGTPDLSALQRFSPASVGMKRAKDGPYVRLSDVRALLEAKASAASAGEPNVPESRSAAAGTQHS